MDIFEAARANEGRHRGRYEAALAAADADIAARLGAFVESVARDGSVSINMRLFVAENFISGHPYENIHEFCERMAELSGRAAPDILREKLGSYWERRTKFDAYLTDSWLLYYAALNIGGTGATSYGDFCVILGRCLELHGRRVAYLRDDSLNGYVDAAAGVDESRLLADLCAEAERVYLAAMKHIDDIPRTDAGGWDSMVCSDRSYIEAIFDARPGRQEVSEIRLPASCYDRLWDIAFADFSRPLEPGEKAEANDFAQLLDAAGTAGIAVRAV